MNGKPHSIYAFILINAPVVFLAVVNDILRDFLSIFVFIYLDDILIFFKKPQEHCVHVHSILQRFLEIRLYVKAKKFVPRFFCHLSGLYFGRRTGEDRPSQDPSCKWRAHFHVTQGPTTPHLHQSPVCLVHWSQNRLCLAKTPVLIHPDTTKPFIIEVVASDSGVRAVLCSQCSGLIGKLQLCAFFCHLLQRKIMMWATGSC